MGRALLIMGPPGSGKGTQAARIASRRALAHVSTGDMFRAAMAAGSELGQRVKAVVESGNLVGDEIVLELVRERLSQSDARIGFMLDGFPRTVPQAEGLIGVLEKEDRCLDMAVVLRVEDEQIAERMLARGRTDDTRETIQHRLDVYNAQTEPVLSFLRERGIAVAEVDGVGSIEEITERIEGVLDAADTA